MDGLMSYHIYKSDRFIITGNMGYRLVITDNHEDKSYVLQHTELSKFRAKWVRIIKHANREKFLSAVASYKSKEPVKKEAA